MMIAPEKLTNTIRTKWSKNIFLSLFVAVGFSILFFSKDKRGKHEYAKYHNNTIISISPNNNYLLRGKIYSAE